MIEQSERNLTTDIFEMYRSISIAKNEICKECNKDGQLDMPLSIYHVGGKFHSARNSILFVGKTAIGGEGVGDLIDESFYDVTQFGAMSLSLEEPYATRRHFYNYTNEIIRSYFGSYEAGKDYIALSNMVKCNNGSVKDKSTYQTKINCINKLKVIWQEVEILRPKRIIFYTGNDYDDFIDSYTPSDCSKFEDVVDDAVNCWWHRRFTNQEEEVFCNFLRVFHPMLQVKESYTQRIVQWLKQTE